MPRIQDFSSHFELFNEFYSKIKEETAFHREIENDKLQETIDSYEQLFLSNYRKRKKEGVYFTDANIARLMICELLLLHINEELIEGNLLTDPFNKLSLIIDASDLVKERIKKLLIKTVFMDPACGSGIFLLESAHLVFTLLMQLNPNMNSEQVKLEILKNMRGFDINEFSTKLTILKLFLWYIKELSSPYSDAFNLLEKNVKLDNSLLANIQSKSNIVLGNPPYGNILDKSEKNQLKKDNLYFQDIYCSFILKSLQLSENIIGLLLPKSFLIRQGYIKFRETLLKKAALMKIIDIGPNLFSEATNEVMILIYGPKKQYRNSLQVLDYPSTHIFNYASQEFDNLKVCLNKKCPFFNNAKKFYAYSLYSKCPYCSSKTTSLHRIRIKGNYHIFEIINYMEMVSDLNYLNVKDYPFLIRGEEDKGLKLVKELVNDKSNNSCYFLNAKDDFNYFYLNKSKSFELEKLSPNDLKGISYEYYTEPKLLIKHNNIYPQAAFSIDNICFSSSIYSLLHKEIDELNYLCALMNSPLIQFYCIYAINNQKNTTINLNQYMIRHLPIMKTSLQVRHDIAEKTTKLTCLFNENKGVLNEKIIAQIKDLNDIIFKIYEIKNDNKIFVLSELSKSIDFFKQVYNS
jgi:hypothetical protein